MTTAVSILPTYHRNSLVWLRRSQIMFDWYQLDFGKLLGSYRPAWAKYVVWKCASPTVFDNGVISFLLVIDRNFTFLFWF